MRGLFPRQVIRLLLEYGVATVAGVVVSFMAFRHYAPAEIGYLAKIQTELGLLAVFMTLALDTPLLKRLANRETRGEALGSALALRSLGVTLAATLSLVLIGITGGSLSQALPWMLVVLIPQAISAFNVSAIVLFYDQALSWVIPARVLASLAFAGGRLLAMHDDWSYYSYMLLALPEAGIALGLTYWRYVQARGEGLRFTVSRATMRMLSKEAAPLVVASFIVTAFFKLDLYVVALLLPSDRFAAYLVAHRIVEAYVMLAGIVLSQYYVALTARTPLGQWEGIAYLVRASSLMVGAIAACHYLGVRPLLLHFFSGKYVEGVEISMLLCLSLWLNVLGTVRGYWMTLEGLHRYHVHSAAVGCGVLLALSYPFTVRWGLQGAAAALILGQAASVFVATWLFVPLRPLSRMLLGLYPTTVSNEGKSHGG